MIDVFLTAAQEFLFHGLRLRSGRGKQLAPVGVAPFQNFLPLLRRQREDGGFELLHAHSGQDTEERQFVEFCGQFARSLRKFFKIVRPFSVRMLSGWNCTPQMGSVLCRTPMISPSSVSAVTSRKSGSVSRAITSEW